MPDAASVRAARVKKLKDEASTRTKKLPQSPATRRTTGAKTTGTRTSTGPRRPLTASEARAKKDTTGPSKAAITRARQQASTKYSGGREVTKLRDEIAAQKTELEELRTAKDQLTDDLQKTQESLESVQSDLEAKLAELNDQKTASREKTTTHLEEIKQYQTLLEEHQAEIEAVQADHEKTLTHSLELQQENTTQKALIAATKKQNEILMGAATDNGSAADEASLVLVEKTAEVESLKGKLSSLESQLSSSNAAREAASVELEVTREQLDAANKRAQESAMGAAGAQSAAEVELEHAHALIAELRKQLGDARSAQATVEAEAAEHRMTASELQIRSEATKMQLAQLTEERNMLSARLKEGNGGVSVQLDEFEASQAKIQMLQEQALSFADKEAELSVLKGRQKATDALQAKLQEELEFSQSEMATLRESFVKATQATKEALQGKLTAIQEKNKATQELAAAQAALESGGIAASPSSSTSGDAEIASLKSDKARLEDEIDQLKSKLDASAAELDSATSLLAESMAGNPQPSTTESDESKLKISSLEKENAALKKQLEDKTSKINKQVADLELQLETAIEMQAESDASLAAAKARGGNSSAPSSSSESSQIDTELLEELASLKMSNARMQSESDELAVVKKKNADLEQANRKSDKAILDLNKRITSLQGELDAATEMLASGVSAGSSNTADPTQEEVPRRRSSTISTTSSIPSASSTPAPKQEPEFVGVRLRSASFMSQEKTPEKDSDGSNTALFNSRASLRKARPVSMFERGTASAPTEPAKPAEAESDGGIASRARSFGKRGGSFSAPKTPKCMVCNKAAYAMESLECEGKMYHKKCFRCQECDKVISLGSYAALNNKLYCKPCFKKSFKLKGNYSEGFGEEQHKMKWINKPAEAEA